MKTRKFGKLGWQIKEIGLGTNYLGQLDSSKKDEGVKTVIRALELGVNFIDTAPMYGAGLAEEIVGEALRNTTFHPHISTKIGYIPDKTLSWEDRHQYDRDSCLRTFEGSLKRLCVDKVSLVLIHDADRMGPPDAVTGKGMALETCRELQRQGLVDGVGVGWLYTHVQAELVAARIIDAVLTFHRYDLVWKDAEILFADATKHGIAIIAGAPFHQGLLVKPRNDLRSSPPEGISEAELKAIENIYQLSREIDMPLTEMGLRFILGKPEISVVIPGASNIQELESNIKSAEKGPLPSEIVKRIESNRMVHSNPKNYV